MSDDRDNRSEEWGQSPFPVGFSERTRATCEYGDSPLIRVSPRARRLSIRVYPDARVEVVVPPRARPREVEAFIAAHREWIDSRARDRVAQPSGAATVPAGGHRARADRRASGDCTWRAAQVALRRDGRVRRRRCCASSGAASDARLRAALRTWLLRAARARLAPRVAALAAAMGVHYSQVSIRRQRSRWGSCSARGTISLNCCLLFQRPEVVDYLIVHELTHVKHMNHSARFWQAVERHCADWRALDRELVQGWRHVPRWVFSEGN